MSSELNERLEMDNEQVTMRASELLAAVGYLTDVTPGGCYYHAWRVALVAEHLAAAVAPDLRRDVFYAGLLHEAGAVGAQKHATRYGSIRDQVDDVNMRIHAQRGAALLNWLPGMSAAAQYVATHHEWWNGRGYPDGRAGESIPLGGLILSLASTADLAGCFRSASDMKGSVQLLSAMSGHAWPKELWAAFVESTESAEAYQAISVPASIVELVTAKLDELPLPAELDCEEGVERILHLFSALVDLKDPSTTGHSLRTARRAKVLAEYMGFSDEDAHLAYRAGLVHDCGRLGVDTHILNKSGRLSDREMDVVRKHAQMTIQVMSCLPNARGMIALGRMAGHDHERYDGGGYPAKLSGENIPMISRILSVVDAFDSMVSSANYRLLTPKGAVVRIAQGAGTQFDPNVANALVEAVTKGVMDEQVRAA